MTYFDYLNTFNQWLEDNHPSDKAIVLYYALLNMFNRRGWPKTAGVDTFQLMRFARTSDKKTALSARNTLVEAGFIEYVPGSKGVVTQYRLLSFCGKSLPENTTENHTDIPTSNQTAIPTETPTKTLPLNNTKDIDKDIIYSSPKEKETKAKYHSDWFDRFWALYPKKKSKKDAIKAWDKLKPSLELCKVMDAALRKQMTWKQWQDPQFIPLPGTWIRGENWNDEDTSKLEKKPEGTLVDWDNDDIFLK